MPKTHSAYAPEYWRQMVELVRAGRTPGELAREFECSVSAIRNWVRQADRDEGRREDGLTTAELEELRGAIRTLHEESRGTYGAPRVHAELMAQGCRVSRKRVAPLMREASLAGVSRCRGTRTTRLEPGRRAVPDRVERQFQADAPDRLWVADITYVPTWTGFVYLAIVLDVFSRRVVGWSMAHHLRTELVLGALNMALAQRRPEGVVHHSDSGSQYTSLAFGKRCREMGVLPSTGSAGDCYDNAMAESFFATLECELIDRRSFRTQAEARMAIFEFVESWYNPRRRHSALGYLSPNNFERAAARETPRAVRNAHRTVRGVPGACWSGEAEGKTYPPGIPYRPVLGKTLRPPAIAHLRTGGESPNLSTETG